MLKRVFLEIGLIAFLLSGLTGSAIAVETITFASEDSLEITADVYMAHDKEAPFIVLFHQARWSRGEYQEIAPKLNEMGFNCMAIDQRSGDAINDVPNETARRALEAGKPVNYIDALPDLRSAIRYAREHYADGKLLIWGSSYSAALVLKIAGEHPDWIDGVLAFAPGEYFSKQGQSETYITDAAQKIELPVFITSAKDEKPNWEGIFETIPSKDKQAFLPETAGNHGSRALWEQFDDSDDYWQAVSDFLTAYFITK